MKIVKVLYPRFKQYLYYLMITSINKQTVLNRLKKLTFNFLDPDFPGDEDNHDVVQQTREFLQELKESRTTWTNDDDQTLRNYLL